MRKWYETADENNDAIVSSRIRLARNVKGIPFPKRMNDAQKNDLLLRVKQILNGVELSEVGRLNYIDMTAVPEEELYAMVERHVISPDFAKKSGAKGLVLSDDEAVSVMLLEEDHIRIQVLLGGLQPVKAYEIAVKVEQLLADGLTLAFDEQLGYLTECPTNLGTGLRASVMLHLPILESMGEVSSLADSVAKIGLTVRGMYGEGSRAHGALYQLSNQVTLGISEMAAIENLSAITSQIIQKEYTARGEMERHSLEDNVYRAYGILKYARSITGEELMNLLSRVRLGLSMGIIKEGGAPGAMSLFIEAQPFSLQKKYGRMTPDDRDICRANFIREKF